MYGVYSSPDKSLMDSKNNFLTVIAVIISPELWLFWNMIVMRRMYVKYK